MGFRPLIRGLSISSAWWPVNLSASSVSVPSSGDYQFLREETALKLATLLVSVPSSGDYQFLPEEWLIRRTYDHVSVPSSGDYQFLRSVKLFAMAITKFPSPHPGIINFFCSNRCCNWGCQGFRPLIRGLSISSILFLMKSSPSISFRPLIRGLSISSTPETGRRVRRSGFRPLIRGLSISSYFWSF